MSKLRRNNICSSPRNRNKASNDGISDISSNGKLKLNKGKLMSHGEFLNRIQKSLYYGGSKAKMSIPLSDYIADTFSDTHNGYSLNRLNYSTVGNLRSTPCSLILAMIYLERLKDADLAFTKHVTPTELFLVSMMVATKFYSGHDDEAPYVNWAECLSTTPDNLLQMELSFLSAIDWKVYVSNEEFFEKVKTLEITLARQQGLQRGFYTYLELSSIMPSVQIAKEFLQSMLVLSLSYTVLVATMVASVFLASQIPGTYLNASSSLGNASQSATQLSENSSSPQPIENNEVTNMFSTTSELIEFTDSDLDILLNLALDRLNETSESEKTSKHPNKTSQTSSMYSTWFSLLKIDSFKWPVITNNFNWDSTCDYGINSNFFNDSSTCGNQLSSQPNADRFSFGFNGIKIKWA